MKVTHNILYAAMELYLNTVFENDAEPFIAIDETILGSTVPKVEGMVRMEVVNINPIPKNSFVMDKTGFSWMSVIDDEPVYVTFPWTSVMLCTARMHSVTDIRQSLFISTTEIIKLYCQQNLTVVNGITIKKEKTKAPFLSLVK